MIVWHFRDWNWFLAVLQLVLLENGKSCDSVDEVCINIIKSTKKLCQKFMIKMQKF